MPTNTRFSKITALLGLLLPISTLPAETADPVPETVDPQAIEIMKRASDFLSDAKQFCVSVEMWEELKMEQGSFQFSRLTDVKLRRPDRFRLDIRNVEPSRSFYYDGKTLTLEDKQQPFYATDEVPATIDELIPAVDEKFGVHFPIEDLLISKPFGGDGIQVTSGQYLGMANVLGVICYHIAFQTEAVDFQIWVQDGPLPLVKKVHLKRKEENVKTTLTAIFSNWDLTTPLGDFLFTYTPPDNAIKIPFVLAEEVPDPPVTSETSGSSDSKEESEK